MSTSTASVFTMMVIDNDYKLSQVIYKPDINGAGVLFRII